MVLNVPTPTKEKGQRSLNQEDLYMTRFVSPWSRPTSLNSELWRWWIFNEPVAMICRETLIANILALDWEITARRSELRDELKGVIKHYTKLLEKGGDYYGFDWTGFVEWVMADLQDLPFGSGAELGRKNDSPTGRVLWVKPLDGGTLYPTLNYDYPVIQYYQNYEVIKFPKHAVTRTFMSPRPELQREGWGLAPPEKVYFALAMLYRGDKYYADLLLDSPPAGILDLMDMEKDSALEWVESFREFVAGAPSSFKIPVLYEHMQDVKFIPFGKVPNDIMYDRITLKYAAIVAAAYGMSLSDIGLQTTSASGETLAGSIRQERRTKRTGFARAKKKLKYFIESFLPDELQFNFIDLDDELNVALGRARLSTITALSAAQDKGVINAKEHRLILLGDGLFGSTSLPEEPPPDAEEKDNTPIERPGSLGNPVPVTGGGEGEVRKFKSITLDKSKYFDTHLQKFIQELSENIGKILVESADGLEDDNLYLLRSAIDDSLFGDEDSLGVVAVIQRLLENKRWLKVSCEGLSDELEAQITKSLSELLEENSKAQFLEGNREDIDEWKSEFDMLKEKIHRVNWNSVAKDFEKEINTAVKTFIGKSSVFLLKDLLLADENMIDTEQIVSYDIVDRVYQRMKNHFDEFAFSCIEMESDKFMRRIFEEILE